MGEGLAPEVERFLAGVPGVDRPPPLVGRVGIARSARLPVIADRVMRIVAVDVGPEVAAIEGASSPERRLRAAQVDALDRADLSAEVVVDGVQRLFHGVEHTFECRDTPRSVSETRISFGNLSVILNVNITVKMNGNFNIKINAEFNRNRNSNLNAKLDSRMSITET